MLDRAEREALEDGAGGEAGGEAMLEIEAAPSDPYVQQEVRYTVRLLWRVDLAPGAQLEAPAPANARVQQLGNDASFQTAANLLNAEGFGLSLLWAKNTSVEDFLKLILDHIDDAEFAHPCQRLRPPRRGHHGAGQIAALARNARDG